MRQIAIRSGSTVSMPSSPGGSANAPERPAARTAALRVSARAAAAGESTACSRDAGTPDTTFSSASTIVPTIGLESDVVAAKACGQGISWRSEEKGYNADKDSPTGGPGSCE